MNTIGSSVLRAFQTISHLARQRVVLPAVLLAVCGANIANAVVAVPDHANAVQVAVPGTISMCNPTHTVQAVLHGAGHTNAGPTTIEGWNFSEAAAFGCRVETNGLVATVIADGKLKSGSFKLYFSGSWSGCGTCGGGDFEDSVVIEVEADDEDEGGCGDCSKEELGTAMVDNHSVHFRLNLGRAERDAHGRYQGAGYLELKADAPAASLASPSVLKLPYQRTGVVRMPTNLNSTLEAMRLPQGLVRSVAVTNGYTLECFYRAQVDSAWNPLSNALPFVTWTLTAPDGNTNLLEVTETRNGLERTHRYSHWSAGGTNGWRLDRPDGSYSVSGIVSNGLDCTKTFELRNADDSLVRRTWSAWQYRTNLADTLLVQRIEGDGAVTRTNHYSYYADDHATAANRLEREIHADGSWTYHVYDERGRPLREYSTWLDCPAPGLGSEPDANALGCRVTEYSYNDESPFNYEPVEIVESRPASYDSGSQQWSLEEVASTITTLSLTYDGNLQARTVTQTPGLVTTTRYETNPASMRLGQVQSITHPDGRWTVFGYEPAGTNGVATSIVNTGEANNGSILNGERTVTQTDPQGRLVARLVRVINNGADDFVRAHQTNSYAATGPDFTETDVLTGRTTSTVHDCCGLHSVTDADGVETQFDRDPLHRRVATTVLRGGAAGVKATNVLDAAGQVLAQQRLGINGGLVTLSTHGYDVLGRELYHTNALGGVTTNLYFREAAGSREVTLFPGGGTRTNEHHLDGQLRRVTGTAVPGMAYGYGAETFEEVVCTWTAQTNLNTDGSLTAEWSKTYRDPAGRTVKVLYAPGTAEHQWFYNAQGQLEREVDPDGVTTLYLYNMQGELKTTVLDVNQNGSLEPDGPDRVTDTTTDYLNLSAGSWSNEPARRTRVTQRDDNNADVPVSEHWATVDGLRTASSAFGLTNWTEVSFPAAGQRQHTVTAPDGGTTITRHSYGLIHSVTNLNTHTGTTYTHDEHERVHQVVDARNGAATLDYNAADLVTTNSTPAPADGQSPLTTTTHYNSALQAWRIVQPDGASVTNEFHPNGLLKKTYGARIYPQEYTYDHAQRKQTMTTWTNFSNSTGAAVTTWLYHTNRGWLIGKRYHDNTGPDYTHTAAGRLETRAWARGITTVYDYNSAGDVETITYSDDTPDVTYGYDRRGRQTTVAQTGGTTVNRAYHDAGFLLSETYTGGPLDGLVVTNTFDTLLHRTNVTINYQLSTLNSASYRYGPASRLATVSDGGNSASYSYLANSPLVENIHFTNNGALRMTTTKSYDHLDRLKSVSSINAQPSTLNSFSYQYNAASQRTAITNADASRWSFGYDELGQVTSGKKHWSDGTAVAGQQFEYAFDDIGNRQSATRDGRSSSYTANLLNQYTERTVPGFVNILGLATNTATVTVWTEDGLFPTTHHGDYFRAEIAATNDTPLWLAITNIAVLNQGTNADLIATNIGHLLLPPTPETFTHDLDGNLTSDSLCTNIWNAENRRTVIESRSGVPSAAQVRVTWTHLPDGRWIERIVSTNDGSGYTAMQTNRYVWDGNVLLAVLNHTNGLELAFLRGLDLSGTLQGAGGVGGLLAVRVGPALPCGPLTNTTHFASYDGNGNVAALVNATTGEESARYEAGPFAEPLRMTGPMAKLNPIRYSTQYADDWTGDVKYLHRDHDSGTGRWRSRDPIGEDGGMNLFGFVGNDPVAGVDYLGQWNRKVHLHKTTFWAGQFFKEPYHETIGNADQGVDSNPLTSSLGPEQDRHMYYPKKGEDSRDLWYDEELKNANDLLARADKENNASLCAKAAEAFGRGLHSRQDKSAHRKHPKEQNWPGGRMHPGWWDAWDDEDYTAYGLSDVYWRKDINLPPLYYPWAKYASEAAIQVQQRQFQENEKVAVLGASFSALGEFEAAVRKSCLCRKAMLLFP